MFFPDFADLKKQVRNSLHNTWKNALVLDWIPEEKAQSLSLLQFYVGLRWTKTIKGLKKSKQELSSIYEILNVIDVIEPNQRPSSKKFWQKFVPKRLMKIKKIWPRRGRGAFPVLNEDQRPVKIFIEGQ